MIVSIPDLCILTVILGQVWYMIVSIPDLCILTYFVVSYKQKYVHEVLFNFLFKLAQEKSVVR